MAEVEELWRISWTTTVRELHLSVVSPDELSATEYPHLIAALRTGEPILDGTEANDELREYAATVEGYETESDTIIEDRRVSIAKEDPDA